MTPPETDPTPQDHARGLYPKYQITKADGRPVDPSATYFVLRLDGRDAHAIACRAAALLYADLIERDLPLLARDLREQVQSLEPSRPSAPGR